MSDLPTILAVIPARGGSKGVPRKNIRVVGGKALLAYTVEAASAASSITTVVVSTEDDEIAGVARVAGAEVLKRPPELAADDTPGVAPVLHALEQMPGYDYVVLLQPTSPLRTAGDIDKAVETCLVARAPACVSVSEAEKSPYWMFWVSAGKMQPVLGSDQNTYTRRQDLPPAYALNGAIYVAASAWLLESNSFLTPETVAYVMPAERSLDIDTESDLELFALGFVARSKT